MSVQLAIKDDNMSHIFAMIPVPSDPELLSPAFNCHMDILFVEDVCDDKGHLLNVIWDGYGHRLYPTSCKSQSSPLGACWII
jgi:hypothetical protein